MKFLGRGTRSKMWENCVGVCTDAAASLNDYYLGVVAKIKEVAHKKMLFTHCIIHLER